MVPVPPSPWPSVLLVGPTGSGKTPLGDELERRGLQGRPCLHFDFGANLRAAAAGGPAAGGLTARELERIRASLVSGALFEDRERPMIIKILRRFAETRGLTPESWLVLNGLPRHRRQAEALSTVVAVERVFALEADTAVIRERIRFDPGQDRAGRGDDDLAAVAGRLATFRERTEPLLAFYRKRSVPVSVIRVTARMTAAEMYVELDRTVAEG